MKSINTEIKNTMSKRRKEEDEEVKVGVRYFKCRLCHKTYDVNDFEYRSGIAEILYITSGYFSRNDPNDCNCPPSCALLYDCDGCEKCDENLERCDCIGNNECSKCEIIRYYVHKGRINVLKLLIDSINEEKINALKFMINSEPE